MKTTLLHFFLLISISVLSQNGTIPPILRAQNTLDMMSRGGVAQNTILYGVPIPPGSVIGDFYLDMKWNSTSILLNSDDKLLEGYLTRLDVKNHQLEIRLDKDVKVLPCAKIKSIVWIDSITAQPRYFVNAGSYKIDGTKLNGLIEVIEDGTLPLFKYTSVFIKKSDYNAALDVGSRDDKIIKREDYYFVHKQDLFEFKNKKSIELAFGENAKLIESYIKQNKLSLSKENDLINIFRYYNQISK